MDSGWQRISKESSRSNYRGNIASIEPNSRHYRKAENPVRVGDASYGETFNPKPMNEIAQDGFLHELLLECQLAPNTRTILF
jgi:hypothetical protein